ncbi:FAD binding domain of DNA photolyase-domain-containing protein [Dendryphion nanum]|uniref:FAD binding domain of DNA photolyase-domain-containing protein n=1 Tax=Dendryphion nanum TaxID=256645 RepID=A0A9P9DX55_9PLEO|nr:FAD binding domain of DNA photolyase-domain-containing protein [Dendryphion nanum]
MSKRSSPPKYSSDELGHPSTKRAKQVDSDLPYSHLQSALESQSEIKEVTRVLHWFRGKDLRTQDNTSLHHASQLAKSHKAPLLCAYVYCEAEESWHGTSPARIDFMLSALELMQKELEKDLHIPLHFLNASSREEYDPTILSFVKDNHISHVFANYEYEVDELRRDIRFVNEVAKDGNVQVSLYHDQTIVEPGTLLTGSGTPMKVFTPYHRNWLSIVKDDPSLLDTMPAPAANPSSISKDKALTSLFDTPVPIPSESKSFSDNDDKKRIRNLWPAGHDAGMKRLTSFLSQIKTYAATRSQPAKNSTSRMSAYFSSGQVGMRETLSLLRTKANDNSADFTEAGPKNPGVYGWIREIVFRELYRQTTLTTPHTVMNLPQNLKFDFVEWEEDDEGWKKWCEGRTGEPFIDAGMRQLNTEAYMHNRLRMNVSSYLYCNLLLDYRRGERYFAETLIDWDLSNNTQGWEPSYTVFNPVSQAERNDPDGDYIRKWVPELRDVQGKAVFAPHARLSKDEFEKLGYPKPHVDWKETKQRAIERFKRDMADADP